MANFTGLQLTAGTLEAGAIATYKVPDLVLPLGAGINNPTATRGGTYNDATPDNRRDNYAGAKATTFSADFYYRVYTYETKVDFGNLVSPSTRQWVVWNAYPTPNFITAVAGDTAGLTLEFLPTPKRLRGIEYAEYDITATLDGPSTVDTTLTLTFQNGGQRAVQITYGRLLALQFRPDWSAGIGERLEWLTDVMVAYNGKEQRRRLRDTPRRFFEFDFTITGDTRQRLEALLWSWQTKDWAIPVWFDAAPLLASAAAGTLTLQATTTNLDYSVGGLVILSDADFTTTEVAEIDSLTASTITLKRAITGTWPAATTLISPARPGRMGASISARRFTYDVASMRARFELTDTSAWPATASPTYLGYPVLETRPNWTQDLDYNWSRKLVTLDNGTGASTIDDEAGLPIPAQSHQWTATSRAERATLRSLFYKLEGRRGSLWVPTWTNDLTIIAATSAASAQIDVQNIGYGKYLALQAGRNHIRIETDAGTIYYRKITASTEINASTERLTLDSTLGVVLQPGDIAKVSFLQLMRNAADGVELQHWTGEVCDASATLKGYNHDV